MNTQPQNIARWGAKLNASQEVRGPTDHPAWANRRQQETWRSRGLVLWEQDTQHITVLTGEQALDVLTQMRSRSDWREEGLVVGGSVLCHEITLSGAETKQLFDLLQRNEPVLRAMAEAEEEQKRRALAEVYKLLLDAAARRRAREREKSQAEDGSAAKSISDSAVI